MNDELSEIERRWLEGPQFAIEEITDPGKIARNHAVKEAYLRNEAWLDVHREELFPQAGGKVVAVAGQEAFLADTAEAALAVAHATHPEDPGVVCRYLSPDRGPKIYVGRG